MVNQMVWNNLAHRPVRTGLSVIAVAVEVMLILLTLGLVNGMVRELGTRMRGVGADVLVQPPGSGFLVGLSSAAMSEKIAGKIAEVDGVNQVAPVLIKSTGGLGVVYGIDDRFRKLTGGFRLVQGRDLQGGLEILVDDVYAKDPRNKAVVGGPLDLWNQKFTIVGVVENGQGARLFVPLETVQDLHGERGKVTMFFVKMNSPELTEAGLESLKKLLDGYNLHSMDEYASLMTPDNFPGLKPFVRVMIGISMIIGFLVILLAMYTTVLERTRDIGILKALGASKPYITSLFMREVAVISLLGIILGIGSSFAVRALVLKAFPTLTIDVAAEWLVWAALIAVAGAVIGALYPAVRAARQDPIAALAYE